MGGAQDEHGGATNTDVKPLTDCSRCEELVTEDDMYKRKRKGKTKMGKYCKACGKKGLRPIKPFVFNRD